MKYWLPEFSMPLSHLNCFETLGKGNPPKSNQIYLGQSAWRLPLRKQTALVQYLEFPYREIRLEYRIPQILRSRISNLNHQGLGFNFRALGAAESAARPRRLSHHPTLLSTLRDTNLSFGQALCKRILVSRSVDRRSHPLDSLISGGRLRWTWSRLIRTSRNSVLIEA